MKKLINRKLIQYIQKGGTTSKKLLLDLKFIDVNQFDELYSTKANIKNKFILLYKQRYPHALKDTINLAFNLFYEYNFICPAGGTIYNIHKGSGKAAYKQLLTERSLRKLSEIPKYSNVSGIDNLRYDPRTGEVYKFNKYAQLSPWAYTAAAIFPPIVNADSTLKGIQEHVASILPNQTPGMERTGAFEKLSYDIEDSVTRIPRVLSKEDMLTAGTQSSSAKSSGQNDIKIEGPANVHTYQKDEVEYRYITRDGKQGWVARYKNPTNGQKPGWYWVAEGSTGYDKNGNHNVLENGQWVPVPEEGSSENGSSGNGTSGSQTSSSQTSSSGATPTEFTAASQETNKRDIVPSVIQSTMSPQMTPATTALLPKVTPVARPSNMPLMNRGDVRYTISDVTGSSPYFSSDIELVNGLAGAPDNNMFKQALMNRLGMDKWDSSTALNRLNFLGIKGSIGGSDRRRIRNLINNGTTIAGKIRK